MWGALLLNVLMVWDLVVAKSAADFNITSLPFYEGSLVGNMYSGLMEVATGRSLFFWFFVNSEHSGNSDFPVMMWLNGGPGSSSMTGLFMEHGPFTIS